MTTDFADIAGALCELLKADTKIAALAGTRVFGIELPADEASAMPRHAIVIRPAGGNSPIGAGYARHTGERVDAICFGATPYEANRLSAHVFTALTQMRSRTIETGGIKVKVHWNEAAGGRIALRDTDTNWPASTQPFQSFYATQAIAA